MYDNALPALIEFFTWPNPLYLVLGTLVGMIFGILPGLGGPQVLALLIPVTIGLSPIQAITLLMGASGAISFAGSISAILINTPGSGQNTVTVLDGFQMTRQGKAGVALGASGTSSFLGAFFGAIVLTAILPVARHIVLAFSYPDFFMLAIVGMSLVAIVSQGSIWKGIIAATLGLMLASIGYDPVTGAVRYTFGIDYLWDGIKLVPAVIGLFAITESIELFMEKGSIAKEQLEDSIGGGIFEGIKEVFRNFSLFLRCSVIGTIVGIIPGLGAMIATFFAYSHAVQSSKNPENFGKGDVRGVIAPEAANDAKEGGALVPTLIFGIPGSMEMAVLLGALILHGIEPGPRMMLDNPEIPLVLVYVLVTSNFLVVLFGLAATKLLSRIVTIPTTYVAAVVFTIAFMGAYATDGMYADVIVAFIFALLGLAMKRFNFSRVTLIMGMMLGGMAQVTFHQTLMLSGYLGFFTRPISLGLFIFMVGAFMLPIFRKRVWKTKKV